MSCEVANILCNVIRMHCRDCGKHRRYCVTHQAPARHNQCTCVEVPPEWAVTTYSPAPVEEKEGSEEPNPLVGEKAPDSAGASEGLVARLAVRWVDEAGIAGSYLHPRHVEWVRLLLLALADELWARGEYQVAHILRSEARR